MPADQVTLKLKLHHPVEELTGLLTNVIERLSPELCDQVISPSHPRHDLYLSRLKFCVDYHAARFAENEPTATAQVIARLERGELSARALEGNVLREVMLAQALELGESRAAEVFEAEYLPVVRAIARGLGGERAVAAVENFGAELVLPRGDRGPRIATYLGRTTLRQWLAPVVANALRTEHRHRRPGDLTILHEPPAPEDGASGTADGKPCEELLQPIFAASCRALEPEDRLLLQMLVLDGVPQKDVAKCLGLSSGTITRRRQHAAESVLCRARRLVAECARPRQADDCLQLMLAGDDPALRQRLADVLAQGVRTPIDTTRGPEYENVR